MGATWFCEECQRYYDPLVKEWHLKQTDSCHKIKDLRERMIMALEAIYPDPDDLRAAIPEIWDSPTAMRGNRTRRGTTVSEISVGNNIAVDIGLEKRGWRNRQRERTAMEAALSEHGSEGDETQEGNRTEDDFWPIGKRGSAVVQRKRGEQQQLLQVEETTYPGLNPGLEPPPPQPPPQRENERRNAPLNILGSGADDAQNTSTRTTRSLSRKTMGTHIGNVTWERATPQSTRITRSLSRKTMGT